jgi:glycosyltransferase involved in cell wall biosynthesis
MQQKKARAWIKQLTNSFRPAPRLFKQLDQLREAERAGQAKTLSVPDAASRPHLGQASRKRVVCIISPREFSYSETFLRDHLKWLPAEMKALYGGSRHSEKVSRDAAAGLKLLDLMINGSEFPNRSADGRRLVPVAGRGVDLVLRHVFKVPKQPVSDLALRRYLRRERIEAVLAEFGQTGAQVARACALADIPLIVHFHGSDAYSRRWIEKYLSSYQEMFTIAAAIIAVSRDMMEQLASLGAPPDKLFCNPCGVDADLFAGADPLSAPPTFLAVGRFVEKKGPCLTLLAFERVVRKHPQARLVMFGGGDLLGVCQQLTKALAIKQAVSYRGARSRLEIAAAMRQVRAFVQHSVRATNGDAEGTPVSILEASASGLPVVSTRHGGIQEAVLDGETGFLVDEGDIDGMAERMIKLVESPDEAARLGQSGRRHILAQYSMEKRAAALMEIIEWEIRKKSE